MFLQNPNSIGPMSLAVKSLLVAQASCDPMLSESRAQVLQSAGYRVHTFGSPEELLQACRRQKFDLLLIGHSMEHVPREQMKFIFQTCAPYIPILQLDVRGQTTATTSEYIFSVDEGPEALLEMVAEIVKVSQMRGAKTGD